MPSMRVSMPGIARPLVVATVSAESPSRHIVTTTASVMPNAVTTWSIARPCGSRARIRSMSTTGTTAAPVTASRSEDRSRSARPGALSRDWYSVGAPGKTVIRSDSISRMVSSTSKVATG